MTITRNLTGPAAALAAIGLCGCASHELAEADGFEPMESTRSDADISGPDGEMSVEFSDAALALEPREQRELRVTVRPPGHYLVRFALLGRFEDAFLDSSEVETDANGSAAALLTAPSVQTTFDVLASVGETVSDSLAIQLGVDLTTDLEIEPVYRGSRRIILWTATATEHPDLPCEALGSMLPPPDGSRVVTADRQLLPTILDLPVGVPLRVTLRAGQFAGACRDVPALMAAPKNLIKMDVSDRPLQMSQADFDFHLNQVDSNEWRAVMDPVLSRMTRAMQGNAETDGRALLDAMQQTLTDSGRADDFDHDRRRYDWDAVVFAYVLPELTTSFIRRRAREWLDAGVGRLSATSVFEGSLRAHADAPNQATWTLQRVAGFEATDVGFDVQHQVSWAAEPDDTVRVGATLGWAPGVLITRLADTAVAARETEAKTVPEELARSIDCAAVAKTLAGASGILTRFECDAACFSDLCAEGLAILWEQARNALPEDLDLELAAAGRVVIDEEARPIGLQGDWIANSVLPDDLHFRLEGVAEGGPMAVETSKSE